MLRSIRWAGGYIGTVVSRCRVFMAKDWLQDPRRTTARRTGPAPSETNGSRSVCVIPWRRFAAVCSQVSLEEATMTGIAFLLLAAAAATPCESLASLKLADATITSAVVVPEGPPPARGAAGPAARGGARGAEAPQRQAAAPKPPQPAARGGAPRRTSRPIAACR